MAYILHADKSSEFDSEAELGLGRYLGVILTVIQSHLGHRQHIGLHVNDLQFSCATESGIDKPSCAPTPLRPSVYALRLFHQKGWRSALVFQSYSVDDPR